MTWTIGIYKTRLDAAKALALWSDVYPEESLSIDFDGSHYRLNVALEDDPR